MTSQPNAGGWRRVLPVVFLLVLATSALAPRLAFGATQPELQGFVSPSQDAESLFQTNCAACHTISGGDTIGPDLAGVTTRRDRDWLTRWITNPPEMVADGDPIATELLAAFNGVQMPALPISAEDIEALIAYFEEQDGGSAPAPAPIAAQPGDGNVEAGRNLFTGSSTLQNGGPSCRACHSIAGIGALGGGKLGPDLTTTYDRLGDAMITWPETSVTMRPIFTDKTLTDAEKADLLAFFQSTDVTERSAAVIWQLAGLSLLGAAAIGLLVHLIWRRRLTGVRGPMVNGRK